MTVVLFDADAPDDPALENSHWVAAQTAFVLADRCRVVTGTSVTRSVVEENLADSACVGFAYFGHGRNDALVAPTGVVLDLQNLARVGPRWLHAFACNSGNTLAMSAPREGAGAYLGYNRPVIVEWTVDDLPDELVRILREVVTVSTRLLAEGARSRGALRRAVREAHDQWLLWREEHDTETMPLNERLGLDALVRLYDCLEFEGVDVVE